MNAQKFFSQLLDKVPPAIKDRFFRHFVSVPESARSDPKYQIKIATTQGELEASYNLLHECYVKKELMEPHPSGLRCNQYTFLPHSTAIIVLYGKRVVGTVTLIMDNPLGLPADKDFKVESDNLRRQGRRLIEVSALSVAADFRKQGHAVSFLLMKYLYNFVRDYTKQDCLICTVHPRAAHFYLSLWRFEKNPKIVKYEFVKGALACHLYMKMRGEYENILRRSYFSKSSRKNLALFLLEKDSRFIYPNHQPGQVVYPVLSKELISYFGKKNPFFQELPSKEKRYFSEIFLAYCGNSVFEKLMPTTHEGCVKKQFRLPIHFPLKFVKDLSIYQAIVFDISETGCFLMIEKSQLSQLAHIKNSSDSNITIYIQLPEMDPLRFLSHIVRICDEQNSQYPIGIGVSFQTAQPQIFQFFLQQGLSTQANSSFEKVG